MLVLVVLLVLTNLATAAALVYCRVRPAAAEPQDEKVRAALAALDQQGPVSARSRQFISIEILNPVELAGTRGRLLGLAGSVAPGLTRRMVYDQTAKELKRQLIAQQVVADVHVHSLRPVDDRPAPAQRRTLDTQPVNFVDELDPPVQHTSDQPPV